MKPVTVTQLNRFVKSRIEEDPRLKDLLLSGEISNLTNHYRSGHLYFVLKDAGAAVKAVMFRSSAASLSFAPGNGMKVVARCAVTLYEKDGSYQVYVREMAPDGAGALAMAYEQLKARLEQEGLFDVSRKRPLPRYPRVIGIVTSPTGAALQDMLTILGRRWPLCRVVISPATVQGAGAAQTVIRSLARLESLDGCDVIIMGRGGGSIEDLWAFNDEALARAVFACRIPVVSAVGHETDFTICDFVADLRAPTPSAAAELAVPDRREVLMALSGTERALGANLARRLARANDRVDACARRVAACSPLNRLKEARRRLDACRAQLYRAVRRGWGDKRARLEGAARVAESLSPLRTLSRGYGVLLKGGRAVRSVDEVSGGDRVTVKLADGELSAVAEGSTKYEGGQYGGFIHV